MRRFIEALERRGQSPWTPVLAAGWVASLRMFEEHVWVYLPQAVRREHVSWFGHVFLFYLTLIFVVGAVVHLTTRRPVRACVGVSSAGAIFGILPPIIDVFTYGPGQFSYGYRLDFFATFSPLLYDPPKVTPLGEALTVWLSVALVALYVGVMTRSALKVALGCALHYVAIVLMLAVLPSSCFAAVSLLGGASVNELFGGGLALLSVGALMVLHRPLAAQTLFRLPQIALPPALTWLGGGWVGRQDGHTFVAAATMAFAGWMFAVHNDHYDAAADALGGRQRDIAADVVKHTTVLAAGLWLVVAPAHVWAAVALAAFSIVGFAYHADPLRLKCVFPLSYKTEGLLAAVCFCAGLGASTYQAIPTGSLGVALLIAGGVSLAAIFKDFKDAEIDRAAEVRTLFVIALERGWSMERARAGVATVLALVLAVPVMWFWRARDATAVALALAITAAMAVAVVQTSRRRRLGAWLGLAFIDAFVWTAALSL